MKKNRKFNIFLNALVLSLSVMLGLFIPSNNIAKADTDFVIQKTVFENFAVSDENLDTILKTSDSSKIDFGTKPYLSILATEPGIIYNQILNTKLKQDIMISMKSNDISLDKLILEINTGSQYLSASKSFAELKDENGDNLTILSNVFTDYRISIEKSFPVETFKYTDNTDSEILVKDANLYSITIRYNNNTSGTLNINHIKSFHKVENSDIIKVWNNFTGGDSIYETANDDSLLVSSIGKIEGRKITMSKDADLSVIHDSVTTGYNYLYVDATGDTSNLSVNIGYYNENTSTINYQDSQKLSNPILIDDNIKLKAVKFTYSGEETVTINKILISKHDESEIASNLPYITYDESGYHSIDKFNADQLHFYSRQNEAKSRQGDIFNKINAEYRYTTQDKYKNYVSIDDSNLILDASNLTLNETEYLNFTALYKNPTYDSDFIVFQIKLDEGASINQLKFCFNDTDSSHPDLYLGIDNFYSDFGYKAPQFDENHSYMLEDNYYLLVIDIKNSDIIGLDNIETFISINYHGTGIVYIDEIFFANKISTKLVNTTNKYSNTYTISSLSVSDNSFDSALANGMEIANVNINITEGYDVLRMTLTPDTTDLSSIYFTMNETLYYFNKDTNQSAEEDAEEIMLVGNTYLKNANLKTGVKNTIYLDLNAMGITSSTTLGIYGNPITLQNTTFSNIVLCKSKYTYDIDTSNFNRLKMIIRPSEESYLDYKKVSYAFDDKVFTSEDVILDSGKRLNSLTFTTSPKTVVFDLDAMGVKNTKTLTILTNGVAGFTIQIPTLQKYVDYGTYNVIDDTTAKAIKQETITLGEVNLDIVNSNYTILQMLITPKVTDMSSLYFNIDGTNYYAIPSDETQLPIICTNDVYLKDIVFNVDASKTLNIDLKAMGITDAQTLEICGDNLANTEFSNFVLGNSKDLYQITIENIANSKELEQELDVEAPIIVVSYGDTSKYQLGLVEIEFIAYDVKTLDANQLVLSAEIEHQTKNSDGDIVKSSITATIENKETFDENGYNKVRATLKFEAKEAGYYRIYIYASDAENNTEQSFRSITFKSPITDDDNKNNDNLVKILTYVGIGLVAVGVLALVVVFIIKATKNRKFRSGGNKIRF